MLLGVEDIFAHGDPLGGRMDAVQPEERDDVLLDHEIRLSLKTVPVKSRVRDVAKHPGCFAKGLGGRRELRIMSNEIVYCARCGDRIYGYDFSRNRAFRVG